MATKTYTINTGINNFYVSSYSNNNIKNKFNTSSLGVTNSKSVIYKVCERIRYNYYDFNSTQAREQYALYPLFYNNSSSLRDDNIINFMLHTGSVSMTFGIRVKRNSSTIYTDNISINTDYFNVYETLLNTILSTLEANYIDIEESSINFNGDIELWFQKFTYSDVNFFLTDSDGNFVMDKTGMNRLVLKLNQQFNLNEDQTGLPFKIYYSANIDSTNVSFETITQTIRFANTNGSTLSLQGVHLYAEPKQIKETINAIQESDQTTPGSVYHIFLLKNIKSDVLKTILDTYKLDGLYNNGSTKELISGNTYEFSSVSKNGYKLYYNSQCSSDAVGSSITIPNTFNGYSNSIGFYGMVDGLVITDYINIYLYDEDEGRQSNVTKSIYVPPTDLLLQRTKSTMLTGRYNFTNWGVKGIGSSYSVGGLKPSPYDPYFMTISVNNSVDKLPTDASFISYSSENYGYYNNEKIIFSPKYHLTNHNKFIIGRKIIQGDGSYRRFNQLFISVKKNTSNFINNLTNTTYGSDISREKLIPYGDKLPTYSDLLDKFTCVHSKALYDLHLDSEMLYNIRSYLVDYILTSNNLVMPNLSTISNTGYTYTYLERYIKLENGTTYWERNGDIRYHKYPYWNSTDTAFRYAIGVCVKVSDNIIAIYNTASIVDNYNLYATKTGTYTTNPISNYIYINYNGLYKGGANRSYRIVEIGSKQIVDTPNHNASSFTGRIIDTISYSENGVTVYNHNDKLKTFSDSVIKVNPEFNYNIKYLYSSSEQQSKQLVTNNLLYSRFNNDTNRYVATDIEKANLVYNNKGEIGIDLTFTATFVNEKIDFNLDSGNILDFTIYSRGKTVHSRTITGNEKIAYLEGNKLIVNYTFYNTYNGLHQLNANGIGITISYKFYYKLNNVENVTTSKTFYCSDSNTNKCGYDIILIEPWYSKSSIKGNSLTTQSTCGWALISSTGDEANRGIYRTGTLSSTYGTTPAYAKITTEFNGIINRSVIPKYLFKCSFYATKLSTSQNYYSTALCNSINYSAGISPKSLSPTIRGNKVLTTSALHTVYYFYNGTSTMEYCDGTLIRTISGEYVLKDIKAAMSVSANTYINVLFAPSANWATNKIYIRHIEFAELF